MDPSQIDAVEPAQTLSRAEEIRQGLELLWAERAENLRLQREVLRNTFRTPRDTSLVSQNKCRTHSRVFLSQLLPEQDPAAYNAKILASLPLTKCAMCAIEFKGWGHNAQPILAGEVCDDCNVQVVKQRAR